jgi:hypothetical protein
MTINVPLLEKTLQAIKDNPKEWDQADWRCRSGMCFAGHAAQLAGGHWLNPVATGAAYDSYLVADPDVDDEDDINNHPYYGPLVSAGVRARKVLGLRQGNTYGLFAGSNTLQDLEGIVADIVRDAEEAAYAEAEAEAAV